MSLSDDPCHLSAETAYPARRSASPSSSLSSLMSAGSILPAPPSNSSQSDILCTDSSDSTSLSTKRSQGPSTANVVFPTPRSSSRVVDTSRPHRMPPTPLKISPPSLSQTSVASPRLTTGQKLKRILGGRHKKSDDSAVAVSQATSPARNIGEERYYQRHDSGLSSAPPFGGSNVGLPLSRVSSSARQFTFQIASSTFDALRGKRSSAPLSPEDDPPPLPPKLSTPQTPVTPVSGQNWPASDVQKTLPANPSLESSYRHSEENTTGTQSYLFESDGGRSSESESTPRGISRSSFNVDSGLGTQRREKFAQLEQNAKDVEDWRKSDSTMRTVRLVTSRSPSRPLSVAESSHSGHTVIPGLMSPTNKRLSAFLTDTEYATPEAESETEEEEVVKQSLEDEANLGHARSAQEHVQAKPHAGEVEGSASSPEVRITSPSPAKSVHRRSMSLDAGTVPILKETRSGSHPAIMTGHDAPAAASVHDLVSEKRRVTEPPLQTSASTTGVMTPAKTNDPLFSSSNAANRKIRGRLAAWTAAAIYSTSDSSSTMLSPPRVAGKGLREFPRSDRSQSPASSQTKSAGPQSRGLRQTALNVSNGLARLGRAWSGGSNPPLASNVPTIFGDRTQGIEDRGKHHFSRGSMPHTSSLQGDADGMPPVPMAPNLGTMVRPSEPGMTGLVFGRHLADCVRDTAVDPSLFDASVVYPAAEKKGVVGMDLEIIGGKALEGRRLPALVFRCAQHLEKWGVQEEGLFRISGRSSHVTKIRNEFDSGADYDMSECGPGELDPHAVASVFKAYLRELPDTLLTRNLSPYFDAAMIAESNSSSSSEDSATRGMRGPARLSPALRKPPSLSTFALPVFSSRAPTESLLKALRTLIAKLPKENRDLLRTVTELIKITARRNKETKMPLSNLLLIFCPSLQMSPPLLRVLCEGEGLWNGRAKYADDHESEEEEIEAPVIDIKGPAHPLYEAEKENARIDVDNRDDELSEADVTDIEESEYIPRPREGGTSRRKEVPTVVLGDEELEGYSSFGLTDPDGPSHLEEPLKSADPMFERDADSECQIPFENKAWSPPLLTSSSESLTTSTTTSDSSTSDRDEISQPVPATPAPIEELVSKVVDKRHRRSSTLFSLSKYSSPSSRPSRPTLSGPIQFPVVVSAPVTPVMRRSMLSLSVYSSSPDFGHEGSESPSQGHVQARRMRKPSLQLLLRKRSISSLLTRSSPSTPSPQSAQSYLTTQSCIPPVPPLLEVDLPYSPLKLGLGLDSAEDDENGSGDQPPRLGDMNCTPIEENDTSYTPDPLDTMSPSKTTPSLNIPFASSLDFSRESSNSSAYPATLYYTPRTTLNVFDNTAPGMSSRTTSSYSLLNFAVAGESPDEAEEDWAKSVLLAADAGVRLDAA